MSSNCCQQSFSSIEELEDHEESCRIESPSLDFSDSIQDDLRRQHQDEANNNRANINTKPSLSITHSRESSPDRSFTPEKNNEYDSDANQMDTVSPSEGPFAHISKLLQPRSVLSITQQLAQSNNALESIQHTRMALAQLATSALSNGQPSNEKAVQEMSILQRTMITLQHQQMVQLGIIQQLQAQMSLQEREICEEREPKSSENENSQHIIPSVPLTPLNDNNRTSENSVSTSLITTLMERFKTPIVNPASENVVKNVSSEMSTTKVRSESPSTSVPNVSSTVIQHMDPPPADQPNTLDLLQKSANQVLTNASQGLLTSRLIDDYNKPPDGKDSYYKHRCRYCGKVFGSDSALQIHIRSHTGERPFKCNICGNRFTTKGNLKVHFQRHSSRFPHVKMNPHPIPETMDKLHPPILEQIGEIKESQAAPTGPPSPFSTSPLLATSIPPFHLGAPLPSPLDLQTTFNATNLFRREISRLEHIEPENLRSNADSRNSYQTDHTTNEENCDKDSSESLVNEHIKEEQQTVDDIDENINKEAHFDNMKDDSRLKFNFRDPLHEVFKNNANEPYTERIRDTLRNTLQDHLKESVRESLRERLEESLKLGPKDQDLPLKESVQDLLKDQIPADQFKDDHRESQEHSEDLNVDSDDNDDNKSSNSNIESNRNNSPHDIRIKGDQELKEVSRKQLLLRESLDSDSSECHSAMSEQPTDLRMRRDLHSMCFPNMLFPGPRLPINFPFMPGLSPPFPITSGPPTPGSLSNNIDLSKDPGIYTNLLPRPGSTDNSWEALIEVQKPSETMKLEALVNNLETKLCDPNQCFICHRVLSCKSALQMHYRTHTGERPFKCKICGRAFTTKGNLKTHMGVHRAKPPMRMLHQCPVCHKKFTNALVLQQHIRLHTGEPTDLTAEQIAAAEVRDFPPGMPMPSHIPHFFPNGFPLPSQQHLHSFPSLPLHMRYQLSPEMLRRYEAESLNEDRRDEEEKYLRLMNNSSRCSSNASAEQKMAEDLSLRIREDTINGNVSPRQSVSPTTSDYSDLGDQAHETQIDTQNNLIDRLSAIPSSQIAIPVTKENVKSSAPLDLVSRPSAPSLFPPFGLFPPLLTRASISPASQPRQPMSNINPLYLPNIPGKGNTTCHVCYKIFACQSALEIHYRSHTKERPFKCNTCDRGFSTKGNMKQHMLTHKTGGDHENCCDHSENSSVGDKSSSATTEETEEGKTKGDQSGEDGRAKRQREDDITLPIAKRSAVTPTNPSPTSEAAIVNDGPPILSPEVPLPGLFSHHLSSKSPPSPKSPVGLPLPSSFASPLHIPKSLPIPLLFSSLISPASLAAEQHS